MYSIGEISKTRPVSRDILADLAAQGRLRPGARDMNMSAVLRGEAILEAEQRRRDIFWVAGQIYEATQKDGTDEDPLNEQLLAVYQRSRTDSNFRPDVEQRLAFLLGGQRTNELLVRHQKDSILEALLEDELNSRLTNAEILRAYQILTEGRDTNLASNEARFMEGILRGFDFSDTHAKLALLCFMVLAAFMPGVAIAIGRLGLVAGLGGVAWHGSHILFSNPSNQQEIEALNNHYHDFGMSISTSVICLPFVGGITRDSRRAIGFLRGLRLFSRDSMPAIPEAVAPPNQAPIGQKLIPSPTNRHAEPLDQMRMSLELNADGSIASTGTGSGNARNCQPTVAQIIANLESTRSHGRPMEPTSEDVQILLAREAEITGELNAWFSTSEGQALGAVYDESQIMGIELVLNRFEIPINIRTLLNEHLSILTVLIRIGRNLEHPALASRKQRMSILHSVINRGSVRNLRDSINDLLAPLVETNPENAAARRLRVSAPSFEPRIQEVLTADSRGIGRYVRVTIDMRQDGGVHDVLFVRSGDQVGFAAVIQEQGANLAFEIREIGGEQIIGLVNGSLRESFAAHQTILRAMAVLVNTHPAIAGRSLARQSFGYLRRSAAGALELEFRNLPDDSRAADSVIGVARNFLRQMGHGEAQPTVTNEAFFDPFEFYGPRVNSLQPDSSGYVLHDSYWNSQAGQMLRSSRSSKTQPPNRAFIDGYNPNDSYFRSSE
ncbi:MAG: hypothetical protein ABH859_05410 [Pseudomonadota bacterium]